MSEKQREALERIEAALPHIPESKLEYLQGYADAMQDMYSEGGIPDVMCIVDSL